MKASQELAEREISALRPYSRNARTHSEKQVKQIAASIERFGFTNPVAPAADHALSPMRLRCISKNLTGGLPSAMRSPTSVHVPPAREAV